MSRPTQRPKLQPGQRWVWDFPRPPALRPVSKRIRIVHAGVTLIDTADRPGAYEVLETSHPPVYYVPPPLENQARYFRPNPRSSFCEWKGQASYIDILNLPDGQPNIVAAGWTYPNPVPAFAAISGHLAFYPSKFDACYVDDEQVQAQPGDFYGGWITSDLVGPFKGSPGTMGW
ncbi:MAG: DUF427 domain-containing protein [Planctomycetota bacterium]